MRLKNTSILKPFIYALVFCCFISCNNYSEQYNKTEKFLSDFKMLNELVYPIHKDKKVSENFIEGNFIIGLYKEDSLKNNKQLYEKSKILIDNNQLDMILVHRPTVKQYQITTEHKEPPFGLGLNYIVYSLFYTKLEDIDEEEFITLIIKRDEEKVNWIKKIDTNWYYVVSEHYSD